MWQDGTDMDIGGVFVAPGIGGEYGGREDMDGSVRLFLPFGSLSVFMLVAHTPFFTLPMPIPPT